MNPFYIAAAVLAGLGFLSAKKPEQKPEEKPEEKPAPKVEEIPQTSGE